MTDPAAGAAAAATDPELNPELVAEQRHLDAAYARLEVMRRAAEQVAEGYTDVTRGGTHQARLEREAAEAYTRRRLASFDIGESPLCFGRLDLRPGERGETPPYYIGRISVTDDDLTPLIVDWRAPVSEPFYRATAVEPMGVARRRHFQTQGRRLLGIDDEVFDAEAAAESGFTVVGEGRAVRRARPGAHRPDTRHRGHHPGRAGRSDPRRPQRDPRRRRRSRHRQDRGGAPPRRVPALHAPQAARLAGRAARRAQPRSSCATSTKCCRRWARTK